MATLDLFTEGETFAIDDRGETVIAEAHLHRNTAGDLVELRPTDDDLVDELRYYILDATPFVVLRVESNDPTLTVAGDKSIIKRVKLETL